MRGSVYLVLAIAFGLWCSKLKLPQALRDWFPLRRKLPDETGRKDTIGFNDFVRCQEILETNTCVDEVKA